MKIEYFLNSKQVNQNLFKLDNYKCKWKEHLEGRGTGSFFYGIFMSFKSGIKDGIKKKVYIFSPN